MYALKDKVSNQLSHLLADSPSSASPSPPSPPSPAINSQATSLPEGENTFSSYLSLILSPLSFGGSRSKKHQSHLKPIQSLPVKRDGEDSELQENYSVRYHECHSEEYQKSFEHGKECSSVCKNKQTPKDHHHNDDDASARCSCDNDEFEEVREEQTPQSPQNPLPYLMDDSTFISSELYEFFQSSLPNIVKGCQWILLYSTLKHGISLRTLIRKTADHSGPCLLIVGDREGAVFGGLLECPLRPTAKRKYQGTNQSFVFTTIYGEPRLFRPTGANRYYYLCLNDLLALGGGGNFALHLDGDLLNGTSGPCDTFGNLCLANSPEFELKNVELWGFTHTSRYLS